MGHTDEIVLKRFLGSILDAAGYESEKYLNMSLKRLLLPTPLTMKTTSSYRLKSTINESRASSLQEQYRNNRGKRSCSNIDTAVATGVGDGTQPKLTNHDNNTNIPTSQNFPNIPTSHFNQYMPSIIPISLLQQTDEIAQENNDVLMVFDPWCHPKHIDDIIHKLPFYTRYFELPSILVEYNSKWKVMIESINYDYDCLKL